MDFEEKQIEVLKMEIRRLTRSSSREVLPERVADFVMENCQPKADKLEEPEGDGPDVKCFAVDKVLNVLTEHFGLTIEQLSLKSRKRELVYARHVGIYLLAVKTHLTLNAIGGIFGGRDHTTAIHSRDAILDLMSKNTAVKNEVRYLSKKI